MASRAPSSLRLTASRRRALAQAFAAYDIDDNSVLDHTEIVCLLKEMGIHPTEDEMMEILSTIDKNRDGKIDLHEFQSAPDASLARMGLTDAKIQADAHHMSRFLYSRTSPLARSHQAIHNNAHAPIKAETIRRATLPAAALQHAPTLAVETTRQPVQSYILRRLLVHLCPKLCTLTEEFMKSDRPNEGYIKWDAFTQAMGVCEVPLSDEDLQDVVDYFGDSATGKVNYRAFLEMILKAHAAMLASPPPCRTPPKMPSSPHKVHAPSVTSVSTLSLPATPPTPTPPTLSPLTEEPPWLQEVATTLKEHAAQRGKNLRQVFMALDKQRSGHLSAQAFLSAFNTYDVPLTFSQMQVLVQLYDPEMEEQLAYQEFIVRAERRSDSRPERLQSPPHVRPTGCLSPDPRAAREATIKVLQNYLQLKNGSLKSRFLQLDKHRIGCVTVKQFRDLLDSLPILIDDDVIQELVSTFDPHSTGRVIYKDFLQAIG